VVYRFSLGLFLAYCNELPTCNTLALLFPLGWLLLLLINLPFDCFVQNYRTVVVHGTQLIILLATNYYTTVKYDVEL
jgi:hypothetical protein